MSNPLWFSKYNNKMVTHVREKKIRATHKDLRRVQTAVHMAQKMGEGLGTRPVLLRRVQDAEEERILRLRLRMTRLRLRMTRLRLRMTAVSSF
jgi:hypothetical protein